jgi:hypothetical protein
MKLEQNRRSDMSFDLVVLGLDDDRPTRSFLAFMLRLRSNEKRRQKITAVSWKMRSTSAQHSAHPYCLQQGPSMKSRPNTTNQGSCNDSSSW